MKRFHVHLAVPDLEQSIRFYNGLFGTEPTVRKPDYAKWMLDDPRVNFAISQRGRTAAGLNHLGLQVESGDELAGVRERFAAADAAHVADQPGASCCYAKSDKHWVTDPQGIAWEAFHSLDTIPVYGGDSAAGACNVPVEGTASGCCAGGAKRSQAQAQAACC
ncbi:MAG TPA: ArsI/CadI family heavy metal resistance metalloenzyme [Casimicrobiaceae bacterium]|nr:ArsI/CadI family heavy metal resistance metalloenzyme [Casimicrobiaceae bacterium]